MKLKELLQQNHPVLTDGAMGTYFTQITSVGSDRCEKYNVISPEIIARIHKEYIEAGAKILRTNTFSANTAALGVDYPELKKILSAGFRIANDCAKDNAVVCADISALYDLPDGHDDIEKEYRFIADCFIEEGASVFIFETLSDLDTVIPAIDYIISCVPDAEIIVSFTLLPDGKTRSGLPWTAIAESVTQNKHKLTAVGLNCGSGAAQLYPNAVPFFSYIQQNTDLFTMIMPNAGYPSVVNRRTVFRNAPAYFAEQTTRFVPHNISALGGCCGTTPEYINLLGKAISGEKSEPVRMINYNTAGKLQSSFSSKLAGDKFIIAAELDPPSNADFTKLLKAAEILKNSGVDIITVSDSPLGHAKADSVICSARIMRETGIETLPHICCRDRNINALRSILMGAHSEGIRAVLAVTGDHIAETDRGIIKPVFNLDSTKLMSLVSEMNKDIFADAPIIIGGAFDPAVANPEFALKRLERKAVCGAKFVLTQPVFTDHAIECLKEAKKRDIRVLAGIMPMVSYRNASFMQNEVPGMVIPDNLVQRFSPDMTREEAEETGISIAVELAEKVIPYVDGLYFITPFNRAGVIKRTIERLRR